MPIIGVSGAHYRGVSCINDPPCLDVDLQAVHDDEQARAQPRDRGLHSSTFRLNVSMFCGCTVLPQSIRQGDRAGVTKAAQVELKNGRV